jgi:hypothetical protein
MKRLNLILTMFMGLMIYFMQSTPSGAVVYNNNFQAVEINIALELPDAPTSVYIEPSPSLVPPSYPYFNTNPTDNNRSLQPTNFSLDKNVGRERTPSQNNK